MVSLQPLALALVAGFFGGMGGDAMIGLSSLNIDPITLRAWLVGCGNVVCKHSKPLLGAVQADFRVCVCVLREL